MTTLVEKALTLDAVLDDLDIPHAFGGALALAFHVEAPSDPRHRSEHLSSGRGCRISVDLAVGVHRLVTGLIERDPPKDEPRFAR